MQVRRNHRDTSSERGTALLMIAVVTTGLIGLSFGLVAITHASAKEQRQDKEDVRVSYVCQAGLANSMFELVRGNNGALGSEGAPVAWGTASYWVTRTDPAADIIRLEATGLEDRSGARAELMLRRVPNTIWRYGAFGREFLGLDSNARVDSYNSNLGTYAAQAVNGAGADQHALTNGDVGSNGAVTVEQNAKVWGDAMAGPGSGTTVLGNAVVSGTTAPMSAEVELPEINLPSYASFGALSVGATTTIPTSNRKYTNVTVGTNKTLNIIGPANIVVTNLIVKSGGAINIDSTNGPVEIWVVDDFVLNSNAFMGPVNRHSRDLRLNLLSDNVINPEVQVDLDSIDFESNTELFGTVYAPDAHLEVNSNFQLFGAMISRSVDLDSNCRVHFDEDLLTATAEGQPTFETLCWRELPYTVAAVGGP